MPLPILAEAYLADHRMHHVLATTPGRRVEFRSRKAVITDARDMPHVLRMPGIVVEVSTKYVDQMPGWLRACGERPGPQARVCLPPGYELGGAPDYELRKTALGWDVKEPGDGKDSDPARS